MNNTFYTNCRVHKGKILYRGIQNGKRIQEKFNYEPYIFLPSNKPTGYTTVEGKHVYKKEFDSISSAKKYLWENKDTSGFDYFGLTNFEYLYINDEFKGEVHFDRSLISVVSLDIENWIDGPIDVRNTPVPITAITLRKDGKTYIIGTKYYKVKEDNIFYYLCKDEKELLYKFLEIWQMLDPDVVTGWNIETYDIPFLINRISLVLSEEAAKRMSPWGLLESHEVAGKFGDENQVWDIAGVAVLDYMALYKKFSFKNQESYSLDYIVSVELNENKIDYRTLGYKNLNDLYEKNFELFIDYNIHDVVLVDMLDAKLGFLNVAFSLAYLYKCNYKDAFGTVKPWDVGIHHILGDKNQVIPKFDMPEIMRPFEGGFVKETEPGMYHWLLSVDIKSSYPHQIMSYNISPESFLGKIGRLTIDQLLDGALEVHRGQIDANDMSVAGNLCCFSKGNKGFMAEIMESFFDKRAFYQDQLEKLEKETNGKEIDLETKNKMASLDAMQMALKIAINAFYGMLSNKYCRWYSVDLAEAVTLSGQLAVRWVADRINKYLNKVLKTVDVDYLVGGDTDSCYFTLEALVKKLGITDKKEIVKALEKFYNNHLDKVIKDAFEELHVYMNSYKNKIRMARENIADRAIWTGKKHYALSVMNSKGITYDEPKLKTVGLETNRSSTPMICKDYLKKSIKLIMTTDEDTVVKYIEEVKKDFFTKSFKDISTPGTANNLKGYQSSSNIYLKGSPYHVKGALVYNDFLVKKKLDKKLPLVKSEDKIRITYLKMPNPTFSEVISVVDELPEELGLDQYIDYQRQFEKNYLTPITTILKAVGWEPNKSATLDDIFDLGW